MPKQIRHNSVLNYYSEMCTGMFRSLCNTALFESHSHTYSQINLGSKGGINNGSLS